MAKLYAEIKSDKKGRKVSKGGDNFITFVLSDGGKYILSIDYNREKHQLHINDDTENLVINVDGYIM